MTETQKKTRTLDMPLINDLEVTPRTVVIDSAKLFARALAASPQYHDFEIAYQNFRENSEAQQIFNALNEKQNALKMLRMLNAVSEEERLELEGLENQFYQNVVVKNFLSAQDVLVQTCQQAGDILSEAAGLDFGTACNMGGCCG